MRSILLVPLLVACGPTRPPPESKPPPVKTVRVGCSPSDCAGCCLDGVCVSNPTDALCGSGGAACFACPSGQTCSTARTCVASEHSDTIEAATCTFTLRELRVLQPRALTSVWTGSDEVWAAGPQGALQLQEDTFIVPAEDARIGVGLRAVWSGRPGHLWFLRGGVDAAIHHERDGAGADERSPTGGELFALWGQGDSDVWVGGGSNTEGRIAHWDGGGWKVAAVSSQAVIGGSAGFAVTPFELLTFKDGQWASTGPAPGRLSGGLFVAGPSDVYASGDDGRLHHWLDGTWSSIAASGAALAGIWGQNRRTLFVPLPAGGLRFFDGNRLLALPFFSSLSAISGTGSRAVAVGDGAVLARCATDEELLLLQRALQTSAGGGTSSGGGGTEEQQQHFCITTCVSYGIYGCGSTTTVCI